MKPKPARLGHADNQHVANLPLNTEESPYRIVIPDEKRMVPWVKQVTSLTIVPVA